MRSRTSRAAGLLALLVTAVAIGIAACGSEEPTSAGLGGLDRRYVSVDSADTCRLLVLADDGRFHVTARERDCWTEGRMRPAPVPIATGVWTFDGARLDLEGDGWMVTFEPDSTRVELLARSDTIGSLRWITSTGGSPFSACDLVSEAEFDEFVHPTEGSGSSGW
jgi:hypothetical protein